MTTAEIVKIGKGRILVVEAGKSANGLHAVLNRNADGSWSRRWIAPGSTEAHNTWSRDRASKIERTQTAHSVEEWLTGNIGTLTA